MEIARTLYKGGNIIRADEESLNYYSYTNLGLRCPICGEEVHLKKGEHKKPHFAHFHKTDDSDECALRIETNSSFSGWQNIVEGKGQRREIFQQQFLNILASSFPDFYESKKATKEKTDEYQVEQLVKQCINEFKTNSNKYINYCYQRKADLNHNIDKIFTSQIVCEALDYLLVAASNHKLLYKIISYLFYRKKFNNEICYQVIDLLFKIDWLKSLVDNKDILTILANADYNQVSIWQLINNNIGETTTKTINNCLIDSTKDRLSINPQDAQLIELLNQFPKINLIKTHIHVDKMISHDVVVALDGVYTTGENQETKAGMIKVNYGIGKVLIVSGDKARLIGCLTTIVNNNGNCFTPINDDLDRELSSDRFSNLKRNVYMVAKKTAIAQWDYNVRAMLQIKKLKKAIMARNSRSDFYQLMKKLDK